jgi:hypothetical protein
VRVGHLDEDQILLISTVELGDVSLDPLPLEVVFERPFENPLEVENGLEDPTDALRIG